MESVCLDAPSIEDFDEPLPESLPIPELNTVYLGDCRATMQQWPSSFVDVVVTSVPYFNLRSYLPNSHPSKALEIGCDVSLAEYIDSLRSVFREVRRILKPTGACWINVGDSYDKKKNRLGVPSRLTHALIDDNWIWRDEVIWYKPNVMPVSCNDRTTPSHEPVLMFTKSQNYFYDWFSIKEDWSDERQGKDGSRRKSVRNRGGRSDGYTKPNGIDPSANGGRHPRSVWSIPTVRLNGRKLMSDFKGEDGSYYEIDPLCPWHGSDPTEMPGMPLFTIRAPDGSHHLVPKKPCICKPVEADFFAAMPPRLAERCILSSTSEVGMCPACGAPPRRLLDKTRTATRPGRSAKSDESGKSHKDPCRHVTVSRHAGWARACKCEASDGKPPMSPMIVLDPFMGSGTTAVAATRLGRSWIGCELNPLMVEKLIPARLRALK
jgi:DNA modification methylase